MNQFKRIKSEHSGVTLPENIIENINFCFEEQFNELFPYSMEGKHFTSYGHLFNDEMLMIISLVDSKNNSSPISLFISKALESNLSENPQKSKKIMDAMVELAGIFFQEVLSTKDWNNYNIQWCEQFYKKTAFHLKTTRENIELTLEADKLLASSDLE